VRCCRRASPALVAQDGTSGYGGCDGPVFSINDTLKQGLRNGSALSVQTDAKLACITCRGPVFHIPKIGGLFGGGGPSSIQVGRYSQGTSSAKPDLKSRSPSTDRDLFLFALTRKYKGPRHPQRSPLRARQMCSALVSTRVDDGLGLVNNW